MKLLLVIYFLTILLYTAQGYDVLQLTPENYDEMTQSKSVFIRFYAPWCTHSKKLVRRDLGFLLSLHV